MKPRRLSVRSDILSHRDVGVDVAVVVNFRGPKGGHYATQHTIESARKLALDLLDAVHEEDARTGFTSPGFVAERERLKSVKGE